MENKVLFYKTVKPFWSMAPPFGASNSNIEILGLKNKVLRAIVNVLWYVPNKVLHTDLQAGSIKYRDKITSIKYKDTNLEEGENRRLKRLKPTEPLIRST